MNVLWYEKAHKPYTPHLITMQPSQGPGWVKVSHETPEALEPICVAMREAVSNPKATYLELETLLRRLASSYGALVHRKGGIAPLVLKEYKDMMNLGFLREAGLKAGDLPQALCWRSPIWQPIADHMVSVLNIDRSREIYYFFPIASKTLYHPAYLCKYGIESLKRQVFSDRIVVKYEGPLPPELISDLQEIIDGKYPNKVYKVIAEQRSQTQDHIINLWYLASLDASGKLVKHNG